MNIECGSIENIENVVQNIFSDVKKAFGKRLFLFWFFTFRGFAVLAVFAFVARLLSALALHSEGIFHVVFAQGFHVPQGRAAVAAFELIARAFAQREDGVRATIAAGRRFTCVFHP